MNFYKWLTKLLLRLHSKIYSYIGRAAIRAEGGVHPKHRITNYHQFFLDNVSSEDAVLDIGCGSGELALDVAKKAKRVVGIDFNKRAIALASVKCQASSVKCSFIYGDILTYKFTERFDVIILSNVLEHIDKRIDFLKRIKPLAKKFLIRVPAIDRDWLTLYKKELGLEWRADLTHYLEYTVPILQKELHDAGYKLQEYNVQFGEIWSIAK